MLKSIFKKAPIKQRIFDVLMVILLTLILVFILDTETGALILEKYKYYGLVPVMMVYVLGQMSERFFGDSNKE